jgi:YesN/AraC family two-component response regulator
MDPVSKFFHLQKLNHQLFSLLHFDEYAIKAFKLNSVEYLLKPIKKEHLEFALNKYKKYYSKQNTIPQDINRFWKTIKAGKQVI